MDKYKGVHAPEILKGKSIYLKNNWQNYFFLKWFLNEIWPPFFDILIGFWRVGF